MSLEMVHGATTAVMLAPAVAETLKNAMGAFRSGSVSTVGVTPGTKAKVDASKQAELNREADSIFSTAKEIKVSIAPNDPNAGVLVQSFSTNGKLKGTAQLGAGANQNNANLNSPTTVSNEIHHVLKGGALRSDDRTHAMRVIDRAKGAKVGGVHINHHGKPSAAPAATPRGSHGRGGHGNGIG